MALPTGLESEVELEYSHLDATHTHTLSLSLFPNNKFILSRFLLVETSAFLQSRTCTCVVSKSPVILSPVSSSCLLHSNSDSVPVEYPSLMS